MRDRGGEKKITGAQLWDAETLQPIGGSFPDDVLEHRNAPAKLAANDDSTKFTVAFAEGSRARLLRIVFVGNEGPVPSLNRLKLTTPAGDTPLEVGDVASQRRFLLHVALEGSESLAQRAVAAKKPRS